MNDQGDGDRIRPETGHRVANHLLRVAISACGDGSDVAACVQYLGKLLHRHGLSVD